MGSVTSTRLGGLLPFFRNRGVRHVEGVASAQQRGWI